MLLSAVSVLVVAQPSSEVSEGLMNYPVCLAFCFVQIVCKIHSVDLGYNVTKGIFCVVINECRYNRGV